MYLFGCEVVLDLDLQQGLNSVDDAASRSSNLEAFVNLQQHNLKFPISPTMAAEKPKDPALQKNMDVDYVISYRFANTGT